MIFDPYIHSNFKFRILVYFDVFPAEWTLFCRSQWLSFILVAKVPLHTSVVEYV